MIHKVTSLLRTVHINQRILGIEHSEYFVSRPEGLLVCRSWIWCYRERSFHFNYEQLEQKYGLRRKSHGLSTNMYELSPEFLTVLSTYTTQMYWGI